MASVIFNLSLFNGVLLISAVCKHQLYSVFLIYRGSTRVVVNGNNIYVGIFFLDRLHHTLAADVVWQTAKGLCANDICNSFVCKLKHFCRKQPPLAHLYACLDISLCERYRMIKGRGRIKVGVITYDVYKILLFACQELVGELVNKD